MANGGPNTNDGAEQRRVSSLCTCAAGAVALKSRRISITFAAHFSIVVAAAPHLDGARNARNPPGFRPCCADPLSSSCMLFACFL